MALNKVVVEKYLNSHLFYIRDAQDLTNLTLIEKILQHTSKDLVQIQANLDQLVALFDKTHVRRGIVVKSFTGGYYCWLLDYANYVTTDKVFQLPEELHSIPPTIKIASLNNLVGLHHEFNVETLKVEMECLPYFPSHAVEYVEKKLSKAKYVYFCEERKVGEILCGNFVLQMMDGVHFNLADLLVNEGFARLDRKLFLEALEVNIPKIPIVTTSEEESKVCFTEGIGRGRQRLAAPDAPLSTAAFYQKPFCADCQAKDAIISNSRKIIEDLRNEISRITAELVMFKSHLMKSNQLVENLQFELGLLRGQNQPNPNINDPNINPGTVYFRHVGNNSNHKMRPFVPCTGSLPLF